MLTQDEIVQIITASKKDMSSAVSEYLLESHRKYNKIADRVIDEIVNGRFNSWGKEYVGWVEESFYFGNQGYPDSANWRRNGLHLQCRAEFNVKPYETAGDVDDPMVSSEIESIIAKNPLLEPYISWVDSRVEPSGHERHHMWLHGYTPQDTSAGWRQYISDRTTGTWGDDDNSIIENPVGPHAENVRKLY
jgi:hypothetical protein